ncbi:hypothetical protein [Methanosarcina sp. Kolksee]|nr:hypothetical protein [Methanosarcina sp. Kolksee]
MTQYEVIPEDPPSSDIELLRLYSFYPVSIEEPLIISKEITQKNVNDRLK